MTTTTHPTGVIRGAMIVQALTSTIRILAVLLIVLSVIGTMYALQARTAPLAAPWQIVRDMVAAPAFVAAALSLQGLLTLAQWGANMLAAKQPRWWALYLAALGLSLYWNWQAYGVELIALGVPWLLALLIVAGGDILPEQALVIR